MKDFGWRSIWLFLLFAMVLIVACGGGNDEDILSATGDVMTWENFGREFMQNYCTRCHQSSVLDGASFPLETYAQFTTDDIPHRSRIAVVNAKSMPPGEPFPTELDIARFSVWIDAGYPRD